MSLLRDLLRDRAIASRMRPGVVEEYRSRVVDVEADREPSAGSGEPCRLRVASASREEVLEVGVVRGRPPGGARWMPTASTRGGCVELRSAIGVLPEAGERERR